MPFVAWSAQAPLEALCDLDVGRGFSEVFVATSTFC